MAKKTKEENINLDSILFKCRDILRAARNSGSFFEKRDMMLTLVFLRFIGEKFEDGVEKLRQDLIKEGLDPDDKAIKTAFFDDATFTDGTYNLPVEARWSTIINTPAPRLNVALDDALHSIATSSKQLKGCFIEGTFTTRSLAPNDIKKIVDEVNKISHKAFAKVLKEALPNATFVGFTGTPISETYQTFGEEIDRYTMDQAVADGLTVSIKYHPRITKVLLDQEKAQQIEAYYKKCVLLTIFASLPANLAKRNPPLHNALWLSQDSSEK